MPKISELPFGEPLSGFELFPIVQDNVTKCIDTNQIHRMMNYQLNLSFDNINISINQLGHYYVVEASEEYSIWLPNPADCTGFEFLFSNYDQNLDALFGGDYIPYIQSSTNALEKYTKIPKKQTVKIVCVNGVWNACSFALPGGATEAYSVYSATLKYDPIFGMLFQNVIKNTIGEINLNYISPGYYRIDSAGGLFQEGKTQIFIGQNNNNGEGGNGNFVFYTCRRNNSSQLLLNVFDVDVSNSDVYSDDLMNDLSIEIRVYP